MASPRAVTQALGSTINRRAGSAAAVVRRSVNRRFLSVVYSDQFPAPNSNLGECVRQYSRGLETAISSGVVSIAAIADLLERRLTACPLRFSRTRIQPSGEFPANTDPLTFAHKLTVSCHGEQN